MSSTNFIDLEGHIIRSSMQDEHQIVKIIEKTPEIKNIGKIVCGDTNSNILTFEVNRYYDNVDLLSKNIKFIVKNELGTFTEDAVNIQYNNELLRFSWILSDSVTYNSGSISVAIVFLGTEEGQNYVLKTVPFIIKIENSLDFLDIEPPNKNWFVDIENRLLKLENSRQSENNNNFSNSNIPIGTIISYMGNDCPNNYLTCDGTVYDIDSYQELAQHFLNQFASMNFFGGNGTTTFAVPDLRGEFLRGSGTAIRNTGSGGKVGQHQDGTEHILISKNSDLSVTVYGPVGDYAHNVSKIDKEIKDPNGVTWCSKSQFEFVSTGSTYNYTSRPTNTSVNYCIKAKI